MENPFGSNKSPRDTQASSRHSRSSFSDIAREIAGPDAPRWLPALLEYWSQSVRYDILVDQFRPSKLETVERLSRLEHAVALLRREIDDPSIFNLLLASKPAGRLGISVSALKSLAERAAIAKSSPALVGKSGTTKRGPGKPQVPDVFGAKTICAARIFEAWRFFSKQDPRVGNLKAAAAAQAYWLTSGGTSKGYGDPRNGWYDHFHIVKENEMAYGLKRLIWRQDLRDCEKNGRPPWYLGAEFPYPDGEIRSPSQTM